MKTLTRDSICKTVKTRKLQWAMITACLVLAGQARAAVNVVNLGTRNPPATLGGYTMVAFDPGLIPGTTRYTVDVNWATWGQGYAGNVYGAPSTSNIVINLSGVRAIYFYAEPVTFGTYSVTATDSSGTNATQTVNGNGGSSGFGFYETGAGTLTSIAVSADPNSVGFGIGEFADDIGSFSVPPPQLTITHSGTNVVLTWPTNATGFTLQSSPNLGSAAAWSTNLPTPVVLNGQYAVTNPISGSANFFRLIGN
jgi:hypothetical protein